MIAIIIATMTRYVALVHARSDVAHRLRFARDDKEIKDLIASTVDAFSRRAFVSVLFVVPRHF